MAIYNYRCTSPYCKEFNVIYEKYTSNPSHRVPCGECEGTMQRMFPLSVHIVGSGKEKDGKDLGKVTREKNESLKNKWSGYSYEEQNLREKINEMTEERIGRREDERI